MKENNNHHKTRKRNQKTEQFSVTIGIPTYNEETNIVRLITAINQQKQTFFKIKKIIIVDDSTDKTEEKVKKRAFKNVLYIKNAVRKGQIDAQNKICSLAKTDIVVLLEADTLPRGKEYLHYLLSPFLYSNSLGIVQGKELPVTAQTFFGQVINKQFLVYYNRFLKTGTIKYAFASGRGGRAFSKNVYTQLIWPKAVPEDVFSLLWCREKKYKTDFASDAICYYKGPEKVSDYIRERRKVVAGRAALSGHFSSETIEKFYNASANFYITSFLTFLFTDVVACCAYIFIKIVTSHKILEQNFTDLWSTTSSTKNL